MMRAVVDARVPKGRLRTESGQSVEKRQKQIRKL